MTTTPHNLRRPALDPYAIAVHWPFIRSHLQLDRRAVAVDRALDLLARAQVAAGGERVQLGTTRMREAVRHQGGVGTAGDANSMRRALYDLEDRGVVGRLPGSARRPNAWTFYPDVAHWARMPWDQSAKSVVQALLACPCDRSIRAALAPMNRFAGHALAHLENSAEFALSELAELRRPGLFPVEQIHWRERRAIGASVQAQMPCGTDSNGSGNSTNFEAPYCSEFELDKPLLEANPQREKKFTRLRGIVDRHSEAGHHVYPGSAGARKLYDLAGTDLSLREIAWIGDRAAERQGGTSWYTTAGVEFVVRRAELILASEKRDFRDDPVPVA